MKNMKMGLKMAVGFGGTAVVMLCLVAMFWNISKDTNDKYTSILENEVEMAFASRTAEKYMLEGRRSEKDFLARKDLKYLGKHKGIVDKIVESIDVVYQKSQEKGYSEIKEKAEVIKKQAYHYHEIFSDVVEGYQKIGLDSDSGLKGEFQKAAKELALQFERFDAEKLETHYLFLRRWEKDYMRKGTEKYSSRLLQNLKDYKAMLESSSLLTEQKKLQFQALKNYEEAFVNIIKYGYKSEEALNEYEKIRALAHELEESINLILIKDSSYVLMTCRKDEKDYLMTRDMNYVNSLKANVVILEEKIATSKLSEEHQTTLTNLLEKYKNNFLAIVKQDALIGGKESGLIGAMRKAVHQIEEPIAEIIEFCNAKEHEQVAAVHDYIAGRENTAILIVLFTCLAVLFFVIYLTKSITKPLNESVALAERVASGDLTGSIDVVQEDEIGILANSLNRMSKSLNQVISEVVHSSESVSTRSEEMSHISEALKNSTEETKTQAEGVASSTEEMSANINSIASATEEMNVNINSVASSTEQMSSSISEVSESMKQMNVNIKSVAENSKDASSIAIEATSMSKEATKKMRDLNEAGNEIDKVTDVIKRIAEQTNLLALNATIEAASAGEAGKGFAVVAGEIKELANQSAKAAEDIAQKIEDVQLTTKGAVDVIDGVTGIIGTINDSVKTITVSVEEQNQAAEKVSRSLSDTSIGIDSVAKSIHEINKGTKDLSQNVAEGARGTNEVSRNIQDVSKATIGGLKNAEKVNVVSSELDGLSNKLKSMVSKFSVNEKVG